MIGWCITLWFLGVALILACTLPYSPTILSMWHHAFVNGDWASFFFGWMIDPKLLVEIFLIAALTGLWSLFWMAFYVVAWVCEKFCF